MVLKYITAVKHLHYGKKEKLKVNYVQINVVANGLKRKKTFLRNTFLDYFNHLSYALF